MSRHAESPELIRERACRAAFGKPLIVNYLRGLIAEAIVATALEPAWCWCSEDWAAWDFEHSSGLRLEVKQSAARQSWTKEGARASAVSFDIRPRTGRWQDGVTWVEGLRRYADIYVFAYHPVADGSADHRDPTQWIFYAVGTHKLPASATIGLGRVRGLADPCRFDDLRCRVEDEASRLAAAGTLAEK